MPDAQPVLNSSKAPDNFDESPFAVIILYNALDHERTKQALIKAILDGAGKNDGGLQKDFNTFAGYLRGASEEFKGYEADGSVPAAAARNGRQVLQATGNLIHGAFKEAIAQAENGSLATAFSASAADKRLLEQLAGEAATLCGELAIRPQQAPAPRPPQP